MKKSEYTGGTRQLEEAFYLLRQLPLRTHALYLIGTVPFALSCVFFLSEMAAAPDAILRLPGAALGLTATYFWMKIFQALFAREAYATFGGTVVPLRPGSFLRATAALVIVQSTCIPVLTLAGNLVFPLGYCMSIYQNASVLAYTQDFKKRGFRGLAGKSLKLAGGSLLGDHKVLLTFFLFSMFVWLNVSALLFLIPMLLRIFIGIGSAFTENPTAALANTTGLTVVTMTALLILGPYFKTLYVVRTFYVLAETTGEDILSRVRAKRSNLPTTALAAALALLCLLPNLPAAEPAPTPPPASPLLEQKVKDVLSRPEYRWRLKRVRAEKAKKAAAESKSAGFIQRMIKSFGKWSRSVWKASFKKIGKFFDWLFDRKPRSLPSVSSPSWFSGVELGGWMRALGLFALTGIVYLLGMAIYKAVKNTARSEKVTGAPSSPIDLTDETILADALEEDEWLRLATEKADSGDYRLAVRAVYLACLAHLAERGTIRLKRAKSNHDYLREARLRARNETTLLNAFGETTASFERIWYGEHAATPALVDHVRSLYAEVTTTAATPPALAA